jgi:[protein-PII] uridylyltransferase
MTDLSALRDKYRQEKQTLWSHIAKSTANGRGLKPTLVRLAKLADKLLIQLWRNAGFDQGEALIAVGGFGRGELFPSSDVDVLVLLPDSVIAEESPVLKAKLEAFIGSCWDSGLEIGSSVRTLKDCIDESEKDVTVKTSLLESRLLAGSHALYQQFQQCYQEAMDPHAFFVAKTLELSQRHNKFENTPYSLEPNCKESPGGLRDLQIILWVARAAGLGHTWDDLAAKGLATPLEVKQIKRNEAVLSLIRARLHLLAKRREDRLVFDLQHALAEAFGYKAQSTPDGKHKQRASEVLMRQYYWAAKAVTQLNQILLLNIEEYLQAQRGDLRIEVRKLNEHFLEINGLLEVAQDDL